MVFEYRLYSRAFPKGYVEKRVDSLLELSKVIISARHTNNKKFCELDSSITFDYKQDMKVFTKIKDFEKYLLDVVLYDFIQEESIKEVGDAQWY